MSDVNKQIKLKINILDSIISHVCDDEMKCTLAGIELKFIFSICQSLAGTSNDILEAYISELDELMGEILIHYGDKKDKTLKDLISKYQYSISIQEVAVKERCPCGSDMNLDTHQSAIICHGCGLIKVVFGTTFDESSSAHIGIKYKLSNSNLQRHFDKWTLHICASESEEEIGGEDDKYGMKLLALMKSCAKSHNIILKQIDIYQIRDILKHIGRSDLNINSALLMKKLSGIGPPLLKAEYRKVLHSKFMLGVSNYESNQLSEKSNHSYYPYYIYKILEQIIPESDVDQRRILYYIYIQNSITLEAEDREWKRICEKNPTELRYKPTDRSYAARYAPQ